MQSLVDTLQALNWLAVVVATFAGFFVGFLWYSDFMLGKQWRKAAGLKPRDKDNSPMLKPVAIGFLTVLVTAVALAVLIYVLTLTTPFQGAMFGVLIVLGFITTNKLMNVLFEQRSMQVFWINFGGDIVTLAVMGAILAVWR